MASPVTVAILIVVAMLGVAVTAWVFIPAFQGREAAQGHLGSHRLEIGAWLSVIVLNALVTLPLAPFLHIEQGLTTGTFLVAALSTDVPMLLIVYVRLIMPGALTWRDLEWLRSASDLPLVVKGVLTAEDALLAAEHGATAVVVSNHGGRQLDGVPATLDVLPEVVDAVGERVEVLIDGGIRRGTDVLKALALGARATLAGRAIVWGLAAGGEEGVGQVLALLRNEIEVGLKLLGCASPAAVTKAHVRRAEPVV